jgi:thiamine-phosphate pyrophosphorylase
VRSRGPGERRTFAGTGTGNCSVSAGSLRTGSNVATNDARTSNAKSIKPTIIGFPCEPIYNRPLMANDMNGIDPAVLRLLDANANRAREAMRVVEDYARFVLNDDAISAELKNLRHDFAAATEGWQSRAILHRDVAGDVGTTHKTDAEMQRADAAAVVTAAGKRLGEALRAIEEFSKTFDAGSAAMIESLRYRFYEIEKRLSATLRPGRFDRVRLCVLITEGLCKKPWLDVAAAAIDGGADCLQLREKELDSAELLRRASQLVDVCRRGNAISIINDRPDIALLSDADGVHLGQNDLPAAVVRKLVGTRMIIGVSTHRLDQAKAAVLDGADYIGVGPIFPSSTKPQDFLPGLNFAREIVQTIRLPAVAISGITAENVDEVLRTGMTRVAVSAAVIGCDDVRAAARRLKERMKDEG